MYLLDKEKNEAISINKKTFQELEFKERKHSRVDMQKYRYARRAIINQMNLVGLMTRKSV